MSDSREGDTQRVTIAFHFDSRFFALEIAIDDVKTLNIRDVVDILVA